MANKVIHTSISPEMYNKLKNKYGNGILKVGIAKVMKVAEDKQYTVKSELLKIADKVLVECYDIVEN